MSNNSGAPVSKEELAKQIARTVALKSGEEPDDISFANDQVRYASAAVKSRPEQSYSQQQRKRPQQHSSSERPRSSSSGKKKKKGMSGVQKVTIALVVLLIIIGLIIAGVYLYGMNKVQGKFLANTFINGVDVSGLTQKETYDLLTEKSVLPDKITLKTINGDTVSILFSQIGYIDNVQTTISQYYSQQNHYMWFRNLFSTTEYSFSSDFEYDKEKLHSEIKRKVIDLATSTEPQDAYIKKTDDGFIVIKEVPGDKIDPSKIESVYDFVDSYVESGEYDVDLSLLNCYSMPQVTEEDLQAEADKLNSLYSIEITYDFNYTTEVLGGEEIMDWIIFNEKDPTSYKVDADKAMAYVEELAAKYDTYDKPRKFNSTSRGEITVEKDEDDKGCYGWWIDQQKTCDQLVEIIEEGSSAQIEPIYYTNPNSGYEYTCNPEWRTAESDIGDTYCEIDLEMQHFWYYKKGKLEYECDIVSGMPTAERNTPGGVYKVWFKDKDRVLKGTLSTGETWSTPVTYWNNISTFGIGLHDATWHPYFGGTRYKYYGSHGCINMPYDAAKYVYENIDIGTPVVMYW